MIWNQFPPDMSQLPPPIVPPAMVSPASIGPECTNEFVVGNTLHNPSYLRQDAFGQFMPRDRVQATIRSHLGGFYNADIVRRLVEYSIQNPRVFLTLAVTKLIRKMPLLCSGNFADKDLPVGWHYDQWKVLRVYSVEHAQARPWQCFVQGEDDMSSWDFADIKQFTLNQWLFLAVIFGNHGFKYDIQRDRPLPYVALSQGTAAGGNFGKVFKLGLQADHMRFISRRYLPVVRKDSNQLTPRLQPDKG